MLIKVTRIYRDKQQRGRKFEYLRQLMYLSWLLACAPLDGKLLREKKMNHLQEIEQWKGLQISKTNFGACTKL